MELEIRRIAQGFLVAVLSTSSLSLLAQIRPCTQEWGKSSDGLQMSLFVDSPQPGKSGLPSLRVSLRNAGASDKIIEYGAYCRPNFERNLIALIFTDDKGRSVREFNLGPGPPFEGGICGGMVSHWRIPLSPGAVFSIPINLDHYGHVIAWYFVTGWQPGRTYVLQAVLVSEKGTDQALSNVVQVHFPMNSAPLQSGQK